MEGLMEGRKADGRTLRRTRNREAVLDAVLELFDEGHLQPPMDDIAERAGVSNRSIYRYFEHRDHLIRAAVTYALRRLASDLQFAEAAAGTFDERVERFVDHRLGLHDRLAPVMRAGMFVAVSEPIVAEEFEVGRQLLRRQLDEQFADELASVPADSRRRAGTAAEMAFQFETIEFLAHASESSDDVRTVLADHLHLTLGRHRHVH